MKKNLKKIIMIFCVVLSIACILLEACNNNEEFMMPENELKEIEKEMIDSDMAETTRTINIATKTEVETVKELESKKEIKNNAEKTIDLKTVYITFDDGPGEYTDSFLDLFDKYNAKVTYFCTGNSKEKRDRIKKIYDKGHTIGVHSYSHKAQQIYQSLEAYYVDLVAEEEIIKSVIDTHTRYVRLPYGSSTTLANNNPGIITKITESLTNNGFEYYDWNVSAEESSKYKNGKMVPEEAVQIAITQIEKLLKNKKAQSIIVLSHDTSIEAYQYIELLLEYLHNNGFKMKGIDDNTIPVHHTIYN